MIKKKIVEGEKPAPKSITAAFRALTSGKGWLSFVTVLLWAAVVGSLLGAFAGWIIAQFLHVPQVDLLATFEPAATTRIRRSPPSGSGQGKPRLDSSSTSPKRSMAMAFTRPG